MKNTIFYLASCSTCKKIIKSLPSTAELVYHDIRQEPLTVAIVDEMKSLAGSYEALFSKRAQLYKERDLKNKNLTETDYKSLILEHYTFLSRPVFVIDGKIYIGNSQKVVNEVIAALH
jgi:arsenate reductase